MWCTKSTSKGPRERQSLDYWSWKSMKGVGWLDLALCLRLEVVTASNDVVPEANIGVSSIVPSSKNGADDIQAESKALARAVNASVYSPELLKFKYASRPFTISEFPRFDYLT
ncbi:hypothetical protein L1987_04150 [Smallanthus sonchifolius]|uniref:Uncharacterized protein n=1 Tax=Smallanthus sonchifolius TaxID=185202 RepID=A0ACB9KCT2_9ASTR|nr:hypothetical protein L1987_04150 [Smallanthus sonchifolius]